MGMQFSGGGMVGLFQPEQLWDSVIFLAHPFVPKTIGFRGWGIFLDVLN